MSAPMPRKPNPHPRPVRSELSEGGSLTLRLSAETLEQLERVLSRSTYGTVSQIARHALTLGLTELLRRDDR
jgi:hypothetical protein